MRHKWLVPTAGFALLISSAIVPAQPVAVPRPTLVPVPAPSIVPAQINDIVQVWHESIILDNGRSVRLGSAPPATGPTLTVGILVWRGDDGGTLTVASERYDHDSATYFSSWVRIPKSCVISERSLGPAPIDPGQVVNVNTALPTIRRAP